MPVTKGASVTVTARGVLGVVLGVALLGSIGGCGGAYMLRGKVVRGGHGGVLFVPADDEQFSREGVANATISVHRDAGRLNQELVATGRSDLLGRFTIAIDEIGAGWMEYQWLIEVFKPGYEGVAAVVELPSRNDKMHMLAILVEGWSPPPKEKEDLWREYERYR